MSSSNGTTSSSGSVNTSLTVQELAKLASGDISLQSLIAQTSIAASDKNDNDGSTNARVLATQLGSDASQGIQSNDIESEVRQRKLVFGSNVIADKEFDSFLKLCWDAAQDFVLVMLTVMGLVSIAIEVYMSETEGCTTCYIEGAAILMSVTIVTLVTAGIDYAKQGALARLNDSLDEKNTKVITRNGVQLQVTDADIVVGDVLNVNSHNLASIPADCVLLGPCMDLKMNESSLTGESIPVHKRPGDVVLSGTNAVEGTGKMVVIAVGVNSVAGRIKARVYADGTGDETEEQEDTPLTQKLEVIAGQIGLAGTVASVISFVVMAILGVYFNKGEYQNLVDYFIVAITVLAVAVPEGLPLAVTLALAFSSNKMMSEQNLVKHLESCETMGCATTICTDKTGTLTTNEMAVRSIYVEGADFSCSDPSQSLGDMIVNANTRPSGEVLQLVAYLLAIDTMNETSLQVAEKNGEKVIISRHGNPTECALLQLVHELGFDYELIRNSTKGRSGTGVIGEHLSEGKQVSIYSYFSLGSTCVLNILLLVIVCVFIDEEDDELGCSFGGRWISTLQQRSIGSYFISMCF